MDDDQKSMFDLGGKELNPYWIDPKQKLFIPQQPLHWKAHRLQLLLDILDKQAQKNPAQFNSMNYIKTLNSYTRTVTLINNGHLIDPEDKADADGLTSESDDARKVGEAGNGNPAPAVGDGTPAGVGAGVSADNPFAR